MGGSVDRQIQPPRYNYQMKIDRVLSTIREEAAGEVLGSTIVRKAPPRAVMEGDNCLAWTTLDRQMADERVYIQEQHMLIEQKRIRIEAL